MQWSCWAGCKSNSYLVITHNTTFLTSCKGKELSGFKQYPLGCLFIILAEKQMPAIKVIEPEEAEGKLKAIYDELISTRGKLAEVHKIQSLNPESIVNHMDLYMTIMFGKSPIKRVQREMMAVVVSKTNSCTYCQQHHLQAVKHYWKDPIKAEAFLKDFRSVELTEKELVLCKYAETLSRDPGLAETVDITKPLKQAEWSDRAILDATLVVAYFNFVNRIVMGLNVKMEENTGGYKY
jgi:uncharacterized peroxidase-related enzyme